MRYWAFQRSLISSLFKHKKVAARTVHGVGKTVSAASIVTSFLCTRKDSIVISTAPTDNQVKNLLWGWIRKIYGDARVELPGEPDTKQWRIGPRWYGVGLSTDRPGRFQGFHGSGDLGDDPDADLPEDEDGNVVMPEEGMARAVDSALGQRSDGGILFVFDEAVHVDQEIYDAAHGAMVEPETYLLMISNPDTDTASSHQFARAFRPESGTYTIKVALEEGPPDPTHADEVFLRVPNKLVTKKWVKERRKEWGDSALVYSKIWGQFWPGDISARVISAELLALAESNKPSADLGIHMGIDLAHSGADENVAALWVFGEKRGHFKWNVPPGTESPGAHNANKIIALRDRWSTDLASQGFDLPSGKIAAGNIHVDAASWGATTCDRLWQVGVHVDRVDFSSKPTGKWRKLTGDVLFRNRRAELHWVARRAMEEGLLRLDRKWRESREQALWATIMPPPEGSSGTIIQIVPKKEIRKEKGRSPDSWDADLLAWARTGGRPVAFGVLRR